ncbi:MAG TPA: aspartyl protease family protein [Blastocatellia bacterium]|nr:aspartyl protease family protein [Blastocatellia bacterium]
MAHNLRFSVADSYDTRLTGIQVPVIIRSGSRATEFYGRIDTGASFCIFERQHGEKVGIDVEQGTRIEISTVAGSFLAYGHEVTVIVLGIETTTNVYFAAEENFSRNVLGRQGWLDRVRLGLVDYDGQLYLSAYDDPA